ncbi:NTP transferase domain-containing protein [Planctomycetota bacterium]
MQAERSAPESAQVVAVVPAAGSGGRLGGVTKAFLRLQDGQTFLRRIARTCAEAGISSVVCVLAPGVAGPVPAGVTVLRNQTPEKGMLSSIHVALDAPEVQRAAAFLLWPVDCPRVSATTVRRLVSEWREAGAAITVPEVGGRRGHPTLFSNTLLSELRSAPLDAGARAVLRSDRDRVHVVDCNASPEVLDDIDTPADASALGVEA